MKPRFLRLTCLLVGSLIGRFLHAQESAPVSSAAHAGSKVRSAISMLVREDIQKNSTAQQAEVKELADDSADVVVLERLIVEDEKRMPIFTAPRESPLAEILRTGTVAQHLGKKTTVRLWTSGDAGIALSFRR